MSPVHDAAVFAFLDAEQGAAIHAGEQPGYFYGRMGNPTQAALEAALCALEGRDGIGAGIRDSLKGVWAKDGTVID